MPALTLHPLMMPDHFVDNEPQKLLGKIGVELRIPRQLSQPCDLTLFTPRIGGGQAVRGFIPPHRLRYFEPLGQHEDQRRIDIVDAVTILVQLRVGHACLPPMHLP